MEFNILELLLLKIKTILIIIAGVIGAIIAGVKKKMKRKDFIINIITSAFIAWVTGAILGHYMEVSNEVIYALCGLAGHFSDVLYDEVIKIFQSISEYFQKFIDKFI